MDIRNWLAIIVIVFIVLILLDGFRRKWLERKNRIVMKLDKNIPPDDGHDEDELTTKAELPSGGARIKPRQGEGGDNSGEEVPVLMESVDIDHEDIEEYSPDEDWEEENSEEEEAEGELSAAGVDDLDDDLWDDSGAGKEAGEVNEKQSIPAGREKRASQPGERIEPTFGDEELTFGRDDQGELDLEHNELFDSKPESEDEEKEADQEMAEEVIIINVMAKPGNAIEGKRLLPVLLKHGMRLGDMSIFHRHADSDGKGPVMFSMANMLKPGTFSMSDMEEFTTPGICFFMQLPNKMGNMQCFEQMLNTAQAVKEEMDAVLKDENRSVFTRQTIEHSRQRIQDFELEMLARK